MWALVCPLVVEGEKYKQWSLGDWTVGPVPTLCPGAYTDPVRGGVHTSNESNTHTVMKHPACRRERLRLDAGGEDLKEIAPSSVSLP